MFIQRHLVSPAMIGSLISAGFLLLSVYSYKSVAPETDLEKKENNFEIKSKEESKDYIAVTTKM